MGNLRPRLTIPSDPTAVGGLVAGLRSATKSKETNQFDRAIRVALARSELDAAILERLLSNYESIDRRVRRRVLGDMDDSSFVPSRLSAHEASRPKRRGATALFDTIGSTEVVVGPGVFVEDPSPPPPVNWYRIQYNGFHCDRERGDWGWSDEVYLITTGVHIAPDGTNVDFAEQHPVGSSEYSNVDAGDTRLGPIASCWQGLAPVSLTAVAFEHDYGDPDHYKDEIRAAVLVALAYAAWKLGIVDFENLDDLGTIAILVFAAGVIAEGINWFLDTDDDQTDIARTVVLPIETMEAFGRKGLSYHNHEWTNPWTGDTWNEWTDLRYHFRTRHSGGGGLYTFGYQIVRDPPFPPPEPQPVD